MTVDRVHPLASAKPGALVVHRVRVPQRDAKNRIDLVRESEWLETSEEHAKHAKTDAEPERRAQDELAATKFELEEVKGQRDALRSSVEANHRELRAREQQLTDVLERVRKEFADREEVVLRKARAAVHAEYSWAFEVFVLPRPADGQTASAYVDQLVRDTSDLIDMTPALVKAGGARAVRWVVARDVLDGQPA